MEGNGKHLIIVWPKATDSVDLVRKNLRKINADILLEIKVFASNKCLDTFIRNIYSRSQYDLDRIEDKRRNILYNNLQGYIFGVVFECNRGESEWNEERGRKIFPKIIALKEVMRNEIEYAAGAAFYETIHMTDDDDEFQNDFLEFVKLILSSRVE